MDMLSVRKVRLHGMKDKRWLTKDKIVQYKGLINLYKRDQKISNTDKHVMNKKTKALVARLKKRMATTYEQLDRALCGDRQEFKNVLSVDRRVQLAYQLLEPGVMVEHVEQENFTLRKKLDLMQYEKLEKARRLVRLKLRLSELEDMLKYYQPGSLPIEKQNNYYTGLVQDANLKKEAAIVVNESYKKIISVMKKDQIYFDQILFSLGRDSIRQAKCMLETIKLGQLAIEYLDDRRAEVNALEAAVHEDMKNRKHDVQSTRAIVESMNKNVKFKIRRDSDMLLAGIIKMPDNSDVQGEVADICKLMDQLKNSFFINNYTDLFICVKTQKKQQERLRALTDRTLEGKNRLENKVDNATLMYDTMLNTMTEGTQGYIDEKASIMADISDTQHKINTAVEERQHCLKVINDIKISLQQMEQMCKVIVDSQGELTISRFNPRARQKFNSQEYVTNIKEDCSQILEILNRKLMLLIALGHQPIVDERVYSIADKYIEKLTSRRTLSILKESPGHTQFVTSLVEDIQLHDDASVLSRADIKAQSKEIVQANASHDDDDLNVGRQHVSNL